MGHERDDAAHTKLPRCARGAHQGATQRNAFSNAAGLCTSNVTIT
jgi:hypothetical protein